MIIMSRVIFDQELQLYILFYNVPDVVMADIRRFWNALVLYIKLYECDD